MARGHWEDHGASATLTARLDDPMSPVSTRPVHHFARYVSLVGHPFVALPASVGAISALRGGDVHAASVLALVFVAVSLAILFGIWVGRFNNFDVSARERRPRFYLSLVGAMLVIAFGIRDDADALGACLIASAVVGVCGVLNRWTKVSLHTAFALYAAGLWGAWSMGAAFVAMAIAALVAWSRVYLGRHSWSEIRAGAAVGLVGGAVLLARHLW